MHPFVPALTCTGQPGLPCWRSCPLAAPPTDLPCLRRRRRRRRRRLRCCRRCWGRATLMNARIPASRKRKTSRATRGEEQPTKRTRTIGASRRQRSSDLGLSRSLTRRDARACPEIDRNHEMSKIRECCTSFWPCSFPSSPLFLPSLLDSHSPSMFFLFKSDRDS
jgi:hypothetical protein